MTATNGNGPDWAATFAEFHRRHRDVDGKKLVFTAIFNAAMDAFILCAEVPLVWRVLALIWRYSWGNSSDYCVDQIGGEFLGQKAFAKKLGVDNRRVNDCVALLRDLYFVLPGHGHKLYPVDDPAQAASQTDNSENPKYPVPSGYFADFCVEWKIRSLADFEDLESAEATVNRIKKSRLEEYRVWRRGRTIHAMPIRTQPSKLEPSVSVIEPPVSPPASPAPFINKKNPFVVVVKTDDDEKPIFTSKAPEPEFSTAVVAAFVAGGRPSPTARQILKLEHAIPNTPEARAGFIPFLEEKMPRIKHPGSLPSVADEFKAAWPVLLASNQNRTNAEPKCHVCGEPLGDGLALQGCHHECYEQAHEKSKGAGR